MKKIIAILALTLGTGLTAQAQEKSVRPAPVSQVDTQRHDLIKQAAEQDVADLEKVITLTGTQKDSYLKLFERKHRTYAQDLTAERKAILVQTMEKKMKAGLSPENLQKLEANPELIKKLTGDRK